MEVALDTGTVFNVSVIKGDESLVCVPNIHAFQPEWTRARSKCGKPRVCVPNMVPTHLRLTEQKHRLQGVRHQGRQSMPVMAAPDPLTVPDPKFPTPAAPSTRAYTLQQAPYPSSASPHAVLRYNAPPTAAFELSAAALFAKHN